MFHVFILSGNDWFISAVDNGTREGLDKFLKAASSEPETVLHYEFMQDYKVWLLTFWITYLCITKIQVGTLGGT